MRVSIWQQFSSNHSARYTIVGVFPSVEKAREAGAEIAQIVTEIAAWSKTNKDKSIPWMHPSPVEEKYAQKWAIDWEEAVDWLRLFRFGHSNRKIPQREPHEYVITQDRLVIVDEPETRQTGHQFVKLINAMGGEAFDYAQEGEPPDYDGRLYYAQMQFSIRCVAPNNQVADMIEFASKQYFEEREDDPIHHWGAMPWAIYHQRYPLIEHKLPRSEYAGAETTWIEEQRAWYAYCDQHRDENMNLSEEHWENRHTFILQDEDIAMYISMFRRETTIHSGEIARNKQTITLNRVKSFQVAYALPALIAWMQDQGCKVEYTLEQTLSERGWG